MPLERIRHPQKLGDRLGDPDEHDLSLVVLFEGWVEDLERLHASVAEHTKTDWELVVVDNPVDDQASERIRALERVLHIPLRDHVGFAAGRNLGLRQATGRIACVVDTSLSLTGDPFPALDEHLRDKGVGMVGRWGVITNDGFEFVESDGPDVDGVEGYFMAMRRTDLVRTGLFDPRFKFYRNADIDFSFRVRDAGLRTIIDPSLPFERSVHRLWEATPPAKRDDLSHKNFHRFRQHWGGRSDLFVNLR
jgi:cysteinyl-tRNA synthetase